MRTLRPLALSLIAGACAPVPSTAEGWVPPTDDRFTPSTRAATEPEPEPVDDDEGPAGDTDTLDEDDAALRDLYAGVLREPEPIPDPSPDPPATDADADPPPAMAVYPNARPLVGASQPAAFGPRILSILPGTIPPRAVLAMADGRELVVEPGTMLPEDGLIVVAIGSAAVQIAMIEPRGDHALIDTQTLTPLYSPQPGPPRVEDPPQ